MPAFTGDNTAEQVQAGIFTFLHKEERAGWPPHSIPLSASRLWIYNLHYWDFIWCLPYAGVRELVCEAGSNTLLATDPSAWESYPVSLRLMNLCACLFGEHREATDADPVCRDHAWTLAHTHAQWLLRRLERHLMANHLLENAAALCVAGACFEGEDAEVWLEKGREILAAECREQFLADGMHYERSPMYQCRLLYVLKMLLNTNDPSLVTLVEPYIQRGTVALARLCHPDGRIALLNDAALNGTVPASGIADDSNQGDEVFALEDSGYFGARAKGHYVVCDAGAMGPDYQPGHGHADCLSFELSFNGHRVVVDTGVTAYAPGDERAYARSTEAHNTVEINGQDQAECWGAFRVARRYRVHDRTFQRREDGFELHAQHDGYERLPGRPIHARRFAWWDEGVLLVADHVEAERDVVAVSRLHLHPGCRAEMCDDGTVAVAGPGGNARIIPDGGELTLTRGVYWPSFGSEERCTVVEQRVRGRFLDFGYAIVDGGDEFQYALAEGGRRGDRPFAWTTGGE